MKTNVANKKSTRNPDLPKSSARLLADVYIQLSGKPMKLTFVVTNRIFDPTLDSTGLQILMEFTMRVMRGDRPLCLTCDTVWPDMTCEPPAAIAVLTKHEFFCAAPYAEKPAIITPICGDCWHRGNVLERAKAVYRATLWPDLRDVAEPSSKPQ